MFLEELWVRQSLLNCHKHFKSSVAEKMVCCSEKKDNLKRFFFPTTKTDRTETSEPLIEAFTTASNKINSILP